MTCEIICKNALNDYKKRAQTKRDLINVKKSCTRCELCPYI